MFRFDEVVVDRGDRRVLAGVTAVVPPGGVTALFGPSGSGKSTLLRLCNRLEVPTSGVVTYRDTDVSSMDVLALRRRVGMVFQRPTPFAGTVRDNLAVAAADAGEEAMLEALRRTALDSDLLDRDARELSGGELQRMCLARTLITRPETLLLDEPTSALDEPPKRLFERTARELTGQGITILWVTHDAAQLGRVADQVLELRDGRAYPISGTAIPSGGT